MSNDQNSKMQIEIRNDQTQKKEVYEWRQKTNEAASNRREEDKRSGQGELGTKWKGVRPSTHLPN